MGVSEMGFFRVLQLWMFWAMVVLLHLADCAVLIHFNRAPPARTRFTTAVFRYSFADPDGQDPCRHGCSIYCEIDGQTMKFCPRDSIILKNLTVNHDHSFLLSITTFAGERNTSVYKWFIDTIAPTASIVSRSSYTNAGNISINITFSEVCAGLGGFRCENSSSCNVIAYGPANVDPSSLQTIEPDIKYSLVIDLSISSIYGRVVLKMEDKFCTDQAGNMFTRTNGSILVVHFDRTPILAKLSTSVPSYDLVVSNVPRTVLATNKVEELIFFLDFSDPVVNSTKEILNTLQVSSGFLIPIHQGSNKNRRFVFALKNVSTIDIVTVKLQATSLIGWSGTAVSHAMPVIFLYDSTRPGVKLGTGSLGVTKELNINVIVYFTKPVFGFNDSGIEVDGGRLARFKEISKALYSLIITLISQDVVSIHVPEGIVNDVAGNLNLASNQLKVRHYATPPVSIALQSFVTAGLLATSLAAAILTLSSANLAALGALTSGATSFTISDPSRNLLGMVGHLQVFAFSDWLSVSLPIEYSETMEGLRWLIPHGKLPWEKAQTSIWSHYLSPYESPNTLSTKHLGLVGGSTPSRRRDHHLLGFNSNCISSSVQQQMPSPTVATLPILPKDHDSPILLPVKSSSDPDTYKSVLLPNEIVSKDGGLHKQQDICTGSTHYGLPLNSDEYLIYFLKGEPLSAANVVKTTENYNGWQDFKMNMFWLGVASAGLLIIHLLILLFLKWRTGASVNGVLSVPRFELFLLILMLPCLCQSSTFVIRGGTTSGIVTGSLLLAIPAALLLSVSLFLIITIFTGSFFQYKEVKHVDLNVPCHRKLLDFLVGRSTIGKWFLGERLPSSFLPRFGILFEDHKGPPRFVFFDRNDPSSIPEWICSGQSGIGRMRVLNSEDNNDEDDTAPISQRILGSARSAYLILDLLRRVGMGIIFGAYSSMDQSHGKTQCVLALGITIVSFLYMFLLKPYIRRGVQVVESVSLLCEAGVFGLSLYIAHKEIFEKTQRGIGILMLALLFISFVAQLANEWYALIKFLLALTQSPKPSFRLGSKWVAKGLVLPFIPRKHWSRLGVERLSQPKTGLAPVVPLSQEAESERRDVGLDPLSAMTATVVPVYNPDSPGLVNYQKPTMAMAQSAAETNIGSSREGLDQRSKLKNVEGKRRVKGEKLDSKTELRKLRKLARASFSKGRTDEVSTSYTPREQGYSDGISSDNSGPSPPY